MEDLLDFVRRHPRLFVLTGAGISTDSGIPGYRDEQGRWQRSAPMTITAFLSGHAARQRYWARSMVGWPVAAGAQPNVSHRVVAELGDAGRVTGLVTQNVDGLHQRAGSQGVIELHGSIGQVICLSCATRYPRADIQRWLWQHNPEFRDVSALPAADGDAHLESPLFDNFAVPVCERCEGLLKPDVVFFGESVPRERVAAGRLALDAADAVLVIGSSLTVFSGYRFCVWAHEHGLPIAALNLGTTRADPLLTLKVLAPIGPTLAGLAAALGLEPGAG
ncbi:NAD-dependent protein deacetylase [compost metagenome]|uniref:protein acetyllysine N-acetyltransferase n=1 Tax=Cupriavidus campinensis TaxID=151783 RepID=A0AAE9L3K4_9BURK|nr:MULTISPECIES: NAD-dependent protein deacetylase [Cupriavidus]TSP09371.1 NAD-dependent protein deacetylase [Cupriavidus campinensis]URF07167.1 NAD-dependent protein deacetylase [Cupriavidus campinensis]CAG2148062.1 NAD-dependent protein deacetylase [Cupriavidus campinensis]